MLLKYGVFIKNYPFYGMELNIIYLCLLYGNLSSDRQAECHFAIWLLRYNVGNVLWASSLYILPSLVGFIPCYTWIN